MVFLVKGESPVVVAVSGGFDPLHVGHVQYFRAARALGDRLVVILNSDAFLLTKKGYIFMPYVERAAIIGAMRYVDAVIPCVDADQTVRRTLFHLRPAIFAKGGDRTKANIPEREICEELGITMVFGVGGNDKPQSSSWLIDQVRDVKYVEKPWGYERHVLELGMWRVKHLHVDVGHQTSLQYHDVAEEWWFYREGAWDMVTPGQMHRLVGPCDVIEVKKGSDDDIHRLSDDYGRADE